MSHYNTSVSMHTVAAANTKFVYIKATQGVSYRDPLFTTHAAHARSVGLLTGAYHFFDYHADGKIQADNFVDTVDANGGFAGELPPAVDIECLLSLGQADPPTVVRELHEFLAEVYQRTGRVAVIYTSRVMWERVTNSDRTFGDHPLWVACWRCATPILPIGWGSWRFWQDGAAHIPGQKGALDGDMFHGNDGRLRSSLLTAPLIDGGKAYATSAHATVRLGMDGTAYRSSLDGSTWSDWQPSQPKAPVQLANGDGPQTAWIQLKDAQGNLSPVASDSIVLDSTPPQLTLGGLTFALGGLRGGSAVPVSVAWQARDTTSGIAHAELVRTCPDGTSGQLAAVNGAADVAAQPIWVTPGVTCRLTLRGSDVAGLGTAITSLEATVTQTPDAPSSDVVYGGLWVTATSNLFTAGSDHFSKSPGASVTFRASGTQFALLSTYGPDRGRASVTIDGVQVAVVDLYRAKRAYRQIVFTDQLSGGAHTITIRVLGTRADASTASRVDIDALLMMQGGTDATPAAQRSTSHSGR